MHQNRFFSAGALPQTPLGELTALHRPLAVFKGPTSKGREGEGKRGGKGKGGRGRTTLHTPCRKFLATPLDTGRSYDKILYTVPYNIGHI